MPRTEWFQPRANLLIDDITKIDNGCSPLFKARQLVMEGSSASMFEDACFPGLGDRTCGEHVLIACHGRSDVEIEGKTLLWNVADAFETPTSTDVAWIVDRETMILPLNHPLGNTIHILEAYAGGYGGWKFATEALGKFYGFAFQTVALDSDMRTCLHYSVTHDALLIEATQGNPSFDLLQYGKDVILHADAEDDSWLPMIARWGVDLMTISAPCPPWSGAGQQAGLNSDVGCLLPAMLLRCRQLRPRMILLEQVHAFATHAHKQICLDILKHVGYKLVWQRIVDSADFGGVSRLRWLALAIHRHASETDYKEFLMWPKIDQMFPDMLKSVFHAGLPDAEQLEIKQIMISCAKGTTLLPPMFAKHKKCSGNELLELRTSTGQQVLPTVMSMYGQQHLLNRETLEQKGYYGHFFKDSTGKLRLLHPVELQMSHVTFQMAFSTKILVESWKQVGNMISCPHAMLVLINALNALQTPVGNIDVAEAFQALFQNRLRVDDCCWFQGQHGQFCVATSENDSRDWLKYLEHFDAVYKPEFEFRLPEAHAWHPNVGMQPLKAFEAAPVLDVSPVTHMDPESQPDFLATIPFHPMLRVKLLTNQGMMEFWVSSLIQPNDLLTRFKGQMKIVQPRDMQEGYAFELQYQLDMLDRDSPTRNAMPCIHEDSVVFIVLDFEQPILPQLKDMHLDRLQFDQFGILGVEQQFLADTMMLDFRVNHAVLSQHACMIMAAFHQVCMSYMWDPVLLRSVFRLTGARIAKQTMLTFWSSLVDESTRVKLKIVLDHFRHEEQDALAYHHELPIPPEAFDKLLAIMATRQLMDALAEENQIRVVLKWQSKTLWDGHLNGEINMLTIADILQCAMFPIIRGKRMRLIHKSKQVCDVSLQELAQNNDKTFVKLMLVSETSGGGGAKDSQKTYARNSLAATLLEQGFNLEWVSEATGTLVEKVGLKQALQIAQLPPGKQRVDEILMMCEKCSLSPPTHVTKTASKAATAAANKTKKRFAVQPNPADYQIEASFFIAENGAPLPQLQQVGHKSSGVVLMAIEQALPWIREQQTISTDELAMVVLGSHENLQTSLQTELMNVPCQDSQQRPVIMKATVIQLGEKRVGTHVSKQPAIDEQTCKTIAVTYWHDDWQKDEWKYIVDHPFAFTRQVLATHSLDSALLSTWGRSLRKDRQPTTAEHATSVQFHATVSSDKLRELLTISGFNKVWITPKDNQGRLDLSWKIIWTEGSIAHINTLAAKTNGCAGMVKNRKSLGLRFAKADYELAWSVIFPDKEIPKEHNVQHLFQLQSLPYGCSAAMLEQWSQHIQWDFKPMKAIGPNAWLIGSANMPPEGLLLFNSKPILLKYLPPRDTFASSPIVAGPQPRRQERKQSITPEADHSGPHFDPWAGYQNQKSQAKTQPTQPRELAGPTEAKFQEHSARLQDHTDKLSKMEEALSKLQTDTMNEFLLVQKREQQNQMQMQVAIQSVKTEIETSFQKAITQQSHQLNDTLGELRQLLQTKQKRSRDDADGDREMDD
eukprot:s4409_g2.t1